MIPQLTTKFLFLQNDLRYSLKRFSYRKPIFEKDGSFEIISYFLTVSSYSSGWVWPAGPGDRLRYVTLRYVLLYELLLYANLTPTPILFSKPWNSKTNLEIIFQKKALALLISMALKQIDNFRS